MDRYEYICVMYLIQDAVMFALRYDVDFELERPNDIWRMYRISIDHLNVLENFENAVDHAYRNAPQEYRVICDSTWDKVKEAPLTRRHATIFHIVTEMFVPEAGNSNILNFMAVISELCSCFWLRDQSHLISTIIDAAALRLCRCYGNLGTSLGVINIIDRAALEYLRTRS